MIEDDVVGRVVGLPDLLQDDGALALELGRIEGRVQQDVGEDVERERHVLLQHLGVIGRALARGIGVEMAADRLDLLGDRAGAAPLGALERHVFEKMRDAVDLRRLVPGADIDPEAERDRVDRVDAVGDDPQPVRQRREPGRHAASWIAARRLRPARVSADEARDRADIVRQIRSIRSRFSIISASAGGSSGRMPVARSTASGNFAGCARRERDDRGRSRPPRPLPRGRRRPRPRYADRSAMPVRR